MNILWFKKEIEPLMSEYEIQYKFFKNGDFGDLNQVEFNTRDKGGELDFWTSGWLNIHLMNYSTGEELLNVFIKPEDYELKHAKLAQLKEIILENL